VKFNLVSFYKNITNQTPKVILIYGFYFSLIVVFSLAVIRDLIYARYFNASIETLTLVGAFMGYYLLHIKQKFLIANYILYGVATFPILLLIAMNHFANFSIIYTILLPLAYFFLFDLKKAIGFSLSTYLGLIFIIRYQQLIYVNEPYLHNPMVLFNIFLTALLIFSFGLFITSLSINLIVI
jgi:hypothetical protein